MSAAWTCWASLVLILTHLCLAGRAGGFGRRAKTREGGPVDVPAHKRQSVQYSTLVGPSFVNTSVHAHIHAPVGQTAHLTCIVKNLHNYTVSWVRARDIHLLTAGETTYTSDDRFVAVNPGGGRRWMLRLHHVRPSDAGTYLCQVSISPPISTPVTLHVTEAVTVVHPGREVFLRAGSRVVLVCEVRGCPFPALPTWYRNKQLQEDTEVYEGHVRGDDIPALDTTTLPSSLHFAIQEEAPITITPTSTITPTPIGLPIAKATFTRPRASASHSGHYTCTNTCTSPVNLTLHVLTGDEETAAMQHLSGAFNLRSPCGASVMMGIAAAITWWCTSS